MPRSVKLPLTAAATVLLAIAGLTWAAPNFVDNNTSLPGTKTDRFPPTNVSQQWTASDANTVVAALSDLRTVAQRSRLNVKAFGAQGNGVTDDAAAFQSALTTAGGLAIGGAFGTIVEVPAGQYVIGSQLSIPGGVGLRGAGAEATYLKAKASFSGTSLVRNLGQTGNQEYASIEEMTIDGNQGSGAVCSTAVVDLVSLFINSHVSHVIVMNGSNVGLRIAASGSPGGAGPIYVQNTWSVNNLGHGILVEEASDNAGAFNGVAFVNVTSEHQGTAKSAVYLKGNGHSGGWAFINTHIEMGGSATSRTGVTIDGVPDVTFDGIQLLTGNAANITAGVQITNDFRNVRIQLRNLTDANLINPVILDSKNGLSVGATSVPWYVTPDVTWRGAPRFTPDIAAGAKSVAFQRSNGTDVAWFDDGGALTGLSTLGGAGVDIVADQTNNRAVMMLDKTKARLFGYLFPDGSHIAFDYLTGGARAFDVDNSGNFRTWQNTSLGVNGGTTTVANALTLQANVASTGSAPSLSSCGTSPSVAANSTNTAGTFTTGSGATTCTLTFSSAFNNAPTCLVDPPGGGTVPTLGTVTTTTLPLTVDVASTTYRYICVGH